MNTLIKSKRLSKSNHFDSLLYHLFCFLKNQKGAAKADFYYNYGFYINLENLRLYSYCQIVECFPICYLMFQIFHISKTIVV